MSPARKPKPKPRQNRAPRNVDAAFFQHAFEIAGMSAAEVGRQLWPGAPEASVRSKMTRSLKGDRWLTADEIQRLADILQLDPATVGLKAGVTQYIATGQQVVIPWSADAQGLLSPRDAAPRHAPRPLRGDPALEAVRIEAPGAPSDGWICYYSDPGRSAAEDVVGRLAVVEFDGPSKSKRPRAIGVLTKGYAPGTWSVTPLLAPGSKPVKSGRVRWAAPVAWVMT